MKGCLRSSCGANISRLKLLPVHAQVTAGGLLMSAGGNKPIHEALIGTVLAVGDDVEVCLLSLMI